MCVHAATSYIVLSTVRWTIVQSHDSAVSLCPYLIYVHDLFTVLEALFLTSFLRIMLTSLRPISQLS